LTCFGIGWGNTDEVEDGEFGHELYSTINDSENVGLELEFNFGLGSALEGSYLKKICSFRFNDQSV
jgi:hypothetical protein